ncbi:hypothetical protein [Haloparvum sedimenti]|uniref:hypothetical protein n=1 Tax=Haloparvum sedimenti TaxID=1678448 RepID=UPI00159ED9CF|nr:hypothetical protein [Haloparvum sedimenti]
MNTTVDRRRPVVERVDVHPVGPSERCRPAERHVQRDEPYVRGGGGRNARTLTHD